jgi:hypothetical protein
MVTRFATSPPTDNSPQPKEAQPLSQLDIRSIQHLDSSALWSDGPEVVRLGAHFLVLYYLHRLRAPVQASPQRRRVAPLRAQLRAHLLPIRSLKINSYQKDLQIRFNLQLEIQ